MPLAVRDSLEHINAQVLAGLDRAASLTVGQGFFEVTAGASSATEALFGRMELGYRPADPLALFAFAQATMPMMNAPAWKTTFEAGVGARLSF